MRGSDVGLRVYIARRLAAECAAGVGQDDDVVAQYILAAASGQRHDRRACGVARCLSCVLYAFVAGQRTAMWKGLVERSGGRGAAHYSERYVDPAAHE